MRKFLLAAVMLSAFSCKKESVILPTQQVESTTTRTDAVVVPQTPVAPAAVTPTVDTTTLSGPYVDIKTKGAKGDGVADDTQAIINAITYAKANNIPNVYFPDGTYLVGAVGHGGGIIRLMDGVGMWGTGVAKCHIKLSGGRYNPNPIFYQDYGGYPSVGNLVINGIDFDGNIANQTFSADYQYCHALKFHSGSNIEVKNCRFQNFRGDGVLFGDTFEPSLNVRIVKNASVHDSEFFNIYREGAMFCAVDGASFYNNNVHGDGYLVGGVDIERHSLNETVLNVSVYNNVFNFTDGYGPVERGGPKAKYRRAVTIGFFYDGYKNGPQDGLAGGHKIYDNRIYQGQIDCWGVSNVKILGNNFTNTYEDVAGIQFLTAPAINIADPKNYKGLVNVWVDNNIIASAPGNGIAFHNYSKAQANNNVISGTAADGINLNGTSGYFFGNSITDAGTIGKPAAGFIVSGNSSGLEINNNQVISTQTGLQRTMDYAVKIVSVNNGTAPKITGNKGKNLIMGSIAQFFAQLNFAELFDNSNG